MQRPRADVGGLFPQTEDPTLAGGLPACPSDGVRTSVGVGYYGGYYGPRPYGYYGYRPSVVVALPGGIDGPVATPLPSPGPCMGDFGQQSAGFDDFGGFDEF